MKKTFQIINVTVPATSNGELGTVVVTENLKQEYSNCTGVFLLPNGNTDFSKLTCSLTVEGQEILPLDTDCSILSFNGNVSLKDTIYDFKSDGIPARSCAMEFTVNNSSNASQSLKLYLVLEN